MLDEHDIHDIELNSLRTQISMVNQQVVLFNRTVRENIAYGQLEHATDEQVIAAAKAAFAHDFIMDLPQGYDTPLGAQGLNLIRWSASTYCDCTCHFEKCTNS